MKVIVPSSSRAVQTNDGTLWMPNPSFAYNFWSRYLEVFSDVTIVVRAKTVENAPEGWNIATGQGVTFTPLPVYRNIRQFAAAYPFLHSKIRKLSHENSATILRLPNVLGLLFEHSTPRNKPIGVEVVGDPYDAFAPKAFSHPLRPVLRSFFTYSLKRSCKKASAVSYVTEKALQRKYPPTHDAFSIHYSSLMLSMENFCETARRHKKKKDKFHLIGVGSLETMSKGVDTLIDALHILNSQNDCFQLTWVGGGKYLDHMKSLATQKGLQDSIRFLGHISSWEGVKKELDAADMFVLPSRQEGLPRAMIEAMARGLPCMGSTIGGIPELLQPENMFIPNNSQAIAQQILKYHHNIEYLNFESRRNIEIAKKYEAESMRLRRNAFYTFIKEQTIEWAHTRFIK